MFVVAVVVVVIAVIVAIVGVRKYRGGDSSDPPIGGHGGNASATAFANPMYEEGNGAAMSGGDDTGYMDVGAAH